MNKKKRAKLTNGGMIALMLAVAMVLTTTPWPAQTETAPQGTIPSSPTPVEPFAVVANFPTGTPNIISDVQFVPLRKIANFLKSHPGYKVVMIGTVSDLPINEGCYVDPNDPAFFSTKSGPVKIKYRKKSDTNNACQMALAKARSFSTMKWLVSNGVNPEQIIILDFYSLALNPGGNLPNQSVVAWMVTTEQTEKGPGIIIQPNIIVNPGNPAIPCPQFNFIFNLPDCCKQTKEEKKVNEVTVVTYTVDCSACQTQPKKCPWYNRWPCMSKEEKLFWGSLAAGGVIGLILSLIRIKADAGPAHACVGGGCP